jgi:hypothetical protein
MEEDKMIRQLEEVTKKLEIAEQQIQKMEASAVTPPMIIIGAGIYLAVCKCQYFMFDVDDD